MTNKRSKQTTPMLPFEEFEADNEVGADNEVEADNRGLPTDPSNPDPASDPAIANQRVDAGMPLDARVFSPTLVRASAGTGKTYQLTARLLKILLAGASPETILATTFTRKAAGEILSRLLLTLARAANDAPAGSLEALRQQVAIPHLPATHCATLFHRLLRDVHRLRICTLDSLFSQIARSLTFDLTLPSGWRLSDELEEVWLRQQAVNALVTHADSSELETLLAMLSRGENRRNVAREMIGVIDAAYQIAIGSTADAWDRLTVPHAPASAEITRIAGEFRLADVPQKSLLKQLNTLAEHLESRDLAPLVESTLIANIAKAMATGEPIAFSRSKFDESLRPAFGTAYDCVQTEALSLLRAQNHATAALVEQYRQQIDRLKEQQRVLSFDDITTRLAANIGSVATSRLHEELDAAVEHLLLDEFQDTSPLQWKVLRVLAESVTSKPVSESPTHVPPSFFCVGDTKQAIYGWRGGRAEIFDAVDRQLRDIHTVEQNTSFRSSQTVLDAVNQAFQNVHRHPMACCTDKQSTDFFVADSIRRFAETFPVHDAATDLKGHVRWTVASAPSAFEPPAKEVGAEQGRAGQGTSKSNDTPTRPDAEAKRRMTLQFAAEAIARLHREAPEQSIGVLTRSNQNVVAMLDALTPYPVDVSQEGGNPLVDSVAVRWVLSALLTTEHPGDGRWFFHVQHSPLCKFLPMDDRATFARTIRYRLEHTGLTRTVWWLCKNLLADCSAQDQVRLRQLMDLTIQYQHIANIRLSPFIELVRTKRVQKPTRATVRVMTIHQAKGLEFDAVFLADLEGLLIRGSDPCVADNPELTEPAKGLSRSVGQKQWHFLSPHWRGVMGKGLADKMTEALCLLYVAMTRAKRGLYLISAPTEKPSIDHKTAAGLLYHAWSCNAPANESGTVLYEHGNADWADSRGVRTEQDAEPSETVKRVRMRFQPLPEKPCRNHPRSVASRTP
ncbi:MAG: UvrD-helicase domain-containing protein [Planctomycetota bacterium]